MERIDTEFAQPVERKIGSGQKAHLASLQPQQRWKDLTDHRNAIAHWETAKVDYTKVADLHRLAMEVAGSIATITRR